MAERRGGGDGRMRSSGERLGILLQQARLC